MQSRSLGVAMLCAAAAAVLFHLAPDRAAASLVVVLLVPWILASAAQETGLSLGRLLLVAAASRLVLVGSPPLLSDDLYRYLFEGLALNQGHNPFLEAPAELAALDPVLAAKVNHAEIPSIYPPVAQLWFRLLALVGTGAWVAQLGMALVDLGNVVLIRRLTPAQPWAAVVYAVHPVAVLESAHGAHLEPLALLFTLLALWGLEGGRTLGAIAVMLGGATKLLPVLLVPTAVRRLGAKRAVLGIAAGLGIAVALAWPVLAAGPALFEAFGTYTAHWSFNGLLHPLLEASLGAWGRRVLIGLGGVVALIAAFLPGRSAWWVVGTGFLVLSPTVHPWYTLWALVPALLLGRRDWVWASVALQGSYLVLATLDGEGGWSPQPWLGPLTWGLALLALYRFREPIPTAP